MKITMTLLCIWATLFLAGCDVKRPDLQHAAPRQRGHRDNRRLDPAGRRA